MATRRTLLLYCDHLNCDAMIEIQVRSAPTKVRFAGWVRSGEQDLCPAHAHNAHPFRVTGPRSH